jgi:glycosyltransferase involved in cell wall biosynthesis
MSEKIYYWIDHTPGFEANSGIQRTSRCLARALEDVGSELVYLQWSNKHLAPILAPDDQLQKFARWGGPAFRPQGARDIAGDAQELGGARSWRKWLLVPEVPYCSNRRVDLTSELVAYARTNGLRIAFIFYDLIPITLPGFKALRRAHERYVARVTLTDLVIPISCYAGREFERYCAQALKLSASEVPQVVPIPLPDEFTSYPRAEAVSEPLEGPIRVVCLGTIEPRKNQATLLRAFNAFCRENPGVDVRLTLIGRSRSGTYSEVQSLVRGNPRTRVISDHLPDDAITDEFRASHFTVFPSIEEGYGLPIAESLWLGKPCLCANFGAMAEIAAGGGCVAVNTRSVDEMKEALASLILDGDLRRRLAHEAIGRHARLWRDYATEILEVLEHHKEGNRISYGFEQRGNEGSILQRTGRTVRSGIQRIWRTSQS